MLPSAKCVGYAEKSYILDAVFSGLTSSSFLESHTHVGGIHGHCLPLGVCQPYVGGGHLRASLEKGLRGGSGPVPPPVCCTHV